jgi:predicted dehydrogenase
MEAIRIGLIGLGAHGIRYARHLAAGEVPGARLGMVCRRDAETGARLAREWGAAFTEDYRRLLDDPAVDAVAVVVPPHLHPRIVAEALAAGKPVLVEKPLAPDAAAGRTLVEAAGRAGVPAMVAHTLRFNTVIREIRDRSAALGELRFLALSQRFEPSSREWLDEPISGGILRNTGVHAFDLVRHLTGREVEEVTCAAEGRVTRRTEDSFGAVLRLSGGGLATVDNSRATDSRSGRIEWVGEVGQLIGDHVHHRLEEIRGRDRKPLPLPAPAMTVRDAMASFIAAVRGESPVSVPFGEGLRAVEIVDACRASASAGRPAAVERAASPGP